jgi:hypothetical protein
MKTKNLLQAASVITPLVLIGVGAYLAYPPAAFIVVGLLWWHDLHWSAKK